MPDPTNKQKVAPACHAVRRPTGPFFPCKARRSSLEPWLEAAKCQTAGRMVLLSSASLNFARFRNNTIKGEPLYGLTKSTHRGALGGDPNRNDNLRPVSNAQQKSPAEFAPEFCEGKLRSKNQPNLLK